MTHNGQSPPSSAEDKFLDRMKQTQPEVRLSQETIDYLEQKMRAAVVDGGREMIKELAKPEMAQAFFGAFFDVMRQQAAQKTGSIVLGGLGKVASRFFWFAAIGLSLIWFGDWKALALAWKAYRAAVGG